MVARGPRRHERVLRPARHHFIGGKNGTARRAQRRLVAAGRHRGVRVKLNEACRGRGIADRGHVVHGMAERDRFELGAGRFDPRKMLEPLVLERALDCAQPVGPLGMSGLV